MVISIPALTVGVSTMVFVMVFESDPQLFVAVKVKSTEPESTSAALGVYTGCNAELSENVPVPELVHTKRILH